MKVIDLLNKIANGEENDLETEFAFDNRVWNFNKFNKSEFCLDGWLLNQEIKITKSLDEEDEFIDIEKPMLLITENSDYAMPETLNDMNFKEINITLCNLIKNQKKIIDKLSE